MLAELVRRAETLDLTALRLEAGQCQQPAMALCERLGFHRIAPWGSYAADPSSVCFEYRLARSGRDR